MSRETLVTRSREALLAEPGEAVLGIVATLAGLVLVVVPSDVLQGSQVVNELLAAPLEPVWPVVYLLSGVLILAGLLRHDPPKSAAGLVLLGTVVAAYVVAIIEFAGFGNTFFTSSLLTALALSCWLRARAIVKGY